MGEGTLAFIVVYIPGYRIGCVSDQRLARVTKLQQDLDQHRKLLDNIRMSFHDWHTRLGLKSDPRKTEAKR